MSLRKIGFVILIAVLGFLSCNNDDDGVSIPEVELLNREDQQKADNDSIVEYLETHYYNSSFFNTNPDARITDLVITEIEEGGDVPDGNTLLSEAMEDEDIVFADTDYKYYYLNLREGGSGNAPTFADDIRVHYEGFTLDNVVFDGNNINTPTSFNLLGTIIGWQRVFPHFTAAESFVIQNDGKVTYNKPGVGLMIIPSGLAYFILTDATPRNLHRKPLVFKVELLQTFESDVDEDGIPSYMEDLDNDLIFSTADDTNDDTDGDGLPDVNDSDDDNDGILTKDEIVVSYVEAATREEVLATPLDSNQKLANFIEEIRDGTGMIISYKGKVITFTDTDNDGIPDYRDAD